jgi:hypothetical protein
MVEIPGLSLPPELACAVCGVKINHAHLEAGEAGVVAGPGGTSFFHLSHFFTSDRKEKTDDYDANMAKLACVFVGRVAPGAR